MHITRRGNGNIYIDVYIKRVRVRERESCQLYRLDRVNKLDNVHVYIRETYYNSKL